MATVQHPTAVVVARAEPRRDRSYTPQESVRVPIQEGLKPVPLPPQVTQEWPDGKTFEHAWGHIWRYQATAIREQLSHMAWPFQAGKAEPSSMVVAMGVGHHNPVTERANISQPGQTTYGDLMAVAPLMRAAGPYAKIV